MSIKPVFVKLAISAVVLLSVQSTAIAQTERFVERKEEGWFWYKDPVFVEPEEVEEIEPEEPELPQVVIMGEPSDEPAPLSTEWFRANLQVYLDKAIDDPSPENVRTYYTMQRIMMDKAQRFAEVAKYVVVGDPMLDETIQRPMGQAANFSMNEQALAFRDELMIRLSSQVGFAYFFESTCSSCAVFGNSVQIISDKLGVQVLPISMDSKPHPNGLFLRDTVADVGQAEKLGARKGSPSLFLMLPPDRWVPITLSATSYEDIVLRTLVIAMNEDLITRDEYRKAYGLHTTELLIPDVDVLNQVPGMPTPILELFNQ